MVSVTAVLKTVSLFVAELISSVTDWFQSKPAWANLEVLEDTELKTTGGGESENRNEQNLLTCRHAALKSYRFVVLNPLFSAIAAQQGKTVWGNQKTGNFVLKRL